MVLDVTAPPPSDDSRIFGNTIQKQNNEVVCLIYLFSVLTIWFLIFRTYWGLYATQVKCSHAQTKSIIE